MIRSRVVDVFVADGHGAGIPDSPVEGYRFRRLTAADFEGSPLGQEKGRAGIFAQRIEQGHQPWGFVASDNSVACYLWLSAPRQGAAAPDFELGLRAAIQPDAAYIWDCRSDPRHERKGLYRHGLVSLVRQAMADGTKSVQIVTRRENIRSKHSIIAAGFQAAGEMRLYALAGFVAILGAGPFRIVRAGTAITLPGVSPA